MGPAKERGMMTLGPTKNGENELTVINCLYKCTEKNTISDFCEKSEIIS